MGSQTFTPMMILGSWSKQTSRFREIRVESKQNFKDFIRAPRSKPAMAALLIVGMFAIAIDAITTYLLIQTRYFSEANAAAAGLMSVMGLEGYILWAIAVSTLALGLLFVRGKNIFAWLLFGGGLMILGFKVLAATNNVYVLVSSLMAWGLL